MGMGGQECLESMCKTGQVYANERLSIRGNPSLVQQQPTDPPFVVIYSSHLIIPSYCTRRRECNKLSMATLICAFWRNSKCHTTLNIVGCLWNGSLHNMHFPAAECACIINCLRLLLEKHDVQESTLRTHKEKMSRRHLWVNSEVYPEWGPDVWQFQTPIRNRRFHPCYTNNIPCQLIFTPFCNSGSCQSTLNDRCTSQSSMACFSAPANQLRRASWHALKAGRWLGIFHQLNTSKYIIFAFYRSHIVQ